ncbi:MAG: Rrf2 family transcriptional regulator [Acidobacteriota bacterium]|nr:Rrf2 family transcriptional regulator [Thermoanaerobaculaceae bacterium]
MQISRSMEYAVRSLVYLASSNKPLSLRQIAKGENIPAPYLAKIMRVLVNGKIVNSTKGRNGGYFLLSPPQKIALYDLYILFEKKEKLLPCFENASFCPAGKNCSQKIVWFKIEKAVMDAFKKVSLKEMVNKNKLRKVKYERSFNQIT